MSRSYTKLFQSILDSTIWQEDDATRIVWITMLAMADQHGEVSSSIPGLARRAGVTIEACEAALETFKAPDGYSRTKDNDGRRIEEIDGGWTLINHAKYRALLSADDRREYKAKKAREYRAAKKKRAHQSPLTDEEELALEQEAEEVLKKPAKTEMQLILSEIWEASPRRSRQRSSKKQVADEWQKIPAKDRPLVGTVINAIRAWKRCDEWIKDGGEFIPGLHLLIKRRFWEDIPEPGRFPGVPNLPKAEPIPAMPDDFIGWFRETYVGFDGKPTNLNDEAITNRWDERQFRDEYFKSKKKK
jgi:hypothetical protein